MWGKGLLYHLLFPLSSSSKRGNPIHNLSCNLHHLGRQCKTVYVHIVINWSICRANGCGPRPECTSVLFDSPSVGF